MNDFSTRSFGTQRARLPSRCFGEPADSFGLAQVEGVKKNSDKGAPASPRMGMMRA